MINMIIISLKVVENHLGYLFVFERVMLVKLPPVHVWIIDNKYTFLGSVSSRWSLLC